MSVTTRGANQHLSGSNDVWKKKVGYHRRSVAETVMFPNQNLAGWSSEPARRWRTGGGSDGDSQSAKPNDVLGYAEQRPARITGVPTGAILSDRLNLVYRKKSIQS